MNIGGAISNLGYVQQGYDDAVETGAARKRTAEDHDMNMRRQKLEADAREGELTELKRNRAFDMDMQQTLAKNMAEHARSLNAAAELPQPQAPQAPAALPAPPSNDTTLPSEAGAQPQDNDTTLPTERPPVLSQPMATGSVAGSVLSSTQPAEERAPKLEAPPKKAPPESYVGVLGRTWRELAEKGNVRGAEQVRKLHESLEKQGYGAALAAIQRDPANVKTILETFNRHTGTRWSDMEAVPVTGEDGQPVKDQYGKPKYVYNFIEHTPNGQQLERKGADLKEMIFTMLGTGEQFDTKEMSPDKDVYRKNPDGTYTLIRGARHYEKGNDGDPPFNRYDTAQPQGRQPGTTKLTKDEQKQADSILPMLKEVARQRQSDAANGKADVKQIDLTATKGIADSIYRNNPELRGEDGLTGSLASEIAVAMNDGTATRGNSTYKGEKWDTVLYKGRVYGIQRTPQQGGAAAPGKAAAPSGASGAKSNASSEPYKAPIDLTRPRIKNADGSVSTERTITVEIEGQHIVIPTIVNGKALTPKEAQDAYVAGTNPAVGIFPDAASAEAYATQRSKDIGEALKKEAAAKKKKAAAEETPAPAAPDEYAPSLETNGRLAHQARRTEVAPTQSGFVQGVGRVVGGLMDKKQSAAKGYLDLLTLPKIQAAIKAGRYEALREERPVIVAAIESNKLGDQTQNAMRLLAKIDAATGKR